jgi:hypothetical protein
VEQHVLEGLLARAGGGDGDSKPLDQLLLADVLRDLLGPQRPVLLLVVGMAVAVRGGRDDAVGGDARSVGDPDAIATGISPRT